MCWAGLIDGRVVIHWFDENERINQHIYLNLLQTVAWPGVYALATRLGYWFQQDGARPHTTPIVLQWLASKFGPRSRPNKKNESYWCQEDPEIEDKNRYLTDATASCWYFCLMAAASPSALALSVRMLSHRAASSSRASLAR